MRQFFTSHFWHRSLWTMVMNVDGNAAMSEPVELISNQSLHEGARYVTGVGELLAVFSNIWGSSAAVEVLRAIADRGFDVNTRFPRRVRGVESKATLLDEAVAYGTPEYLTSLLQMGARETCQPLPQAAGPGAEMTLFEHFAEYVKPTRDAAVDEIVRAFRARQQVDRILDSAPSASYPLTPSA